LLSRLFDCCMHPVGNLPEGYIRNVPLP
jgi:hypothetical protein